MKIWLFRWDEPLPFDKTARLRRAGLLAEKLTSRGHQVVWWTTNFNHFTKKRAFKADTVLHDGDRLAIVTLKCLEYRKNTSLVRFFSQAVIARHFRKMIPAFDRPDLLIVHYPSINLAYAAVRYARREGIPVIVDVRDMWPDTIARIFTPILRPMARLCLSRSFAMKRYVFRQADILLSMSDFILDWATSSSGRLPKPEDQVFYLGAPAAKCVVGDVNPVISAWLEANRGKFICAYVGTFGKSYNLLSVIRAARRLQACGREEIAFILAGDGPSLPALRDAAKDLKMVFMPGWINASESAAILFRADVALIPVNDTTPNGVMCNKLFDYAAAGKPIISSVAGEMKAFIATQEIGLYYENGQEARLVEAIDQLRSDPARTAELAGNSRRIFEAQLNADSIYERYAALAEQLQARMARKDIP